MTPRRVTPQEAAAYAVAQLEARGARFTLDAAGRWTCDLNPVRDLDHAAAADLAEILLLLRDEIRAVLTSARTTH